MTIKLHAEEIRGLIQEQRLTAAEFSRRAGISYNTARNVLAGDMNVLEPTGLKIADALGVDIKRLTL